jgi:HAMP domain-containing protein
MDERLVRRYLLGELAEEERQRLEERLLTDDDFYDAFTALEDGVEEDLIDEYVDGELSGPAHETFSHVLMSTPERVEKLKLVRDLRARAPAPAVSAARAASGVVAGHEAGRGPRRGRFALLGVFQNPWVGLSCAAALLLAVSCSAWLVIRSNRLEAEVRRLQAREQAPRPEGAGPREEVDRLRSRNEELADSLRRSEEQRSGLERELASLKTREDAAAKPGKDSTPAGGPAIFSLFLPATRRGVVVEEKEHVLTLPAGATPAAARARLVLGVRDVDPKDYKNFWATVGKRSGPEVWRSDRVKVSVKGRTGRAILLVPSELLPEGVYVAELNGLSVDGETEPISYVSFRVVRK